ncbi:T9SS type A sorting domain-containing protein [Polaribacter aquimarinus]|uniref:Secretion system C-terminal sorting domain-containing protein n=1 Tax=Polaribacter aquimarinus TaxID=2100726 RepID=A0A2U2J8S8_9FLAO|nr:T9SS type A sorting domain-containing protein [Polaribacter aquimarinus]PWG04724.1 hypothetical protein DIS07_12360 [Polaribacter aquimarinus]
MKTITPPKRNQKKFLFFVFLLLTFFSVSIFSQRIEKYNFKSAAKKEKANYFKIIAKKKEEFKTYDLNNINDLKEYKHFNRWAEYWRLRVKPDGSFTDENLAFYNAGILDSNGKIVRIEKKSNINNQPTWSNIGAQDLPDANGYSNYPQMGRLNAFLRIAHPSDATKDVLFVGAPNGGIWKSTDGGATWSAKLDNVAGIGVTDIKTASTTNFNNYTTKPIYISTGDYDAEHVKSIGVLKSTDGGETFSSTNLTFALNQNKLTGDLVVVDDNTVFVGTTTGISKTSDGGANWTEAFTGQFTNVSYGRMAISGTKIMYSGFWDIAFTNDYTNDNNWKITQGASGNFNKTAVTVGEDGLFYIQDMSGQIKKYDENNNSFSNVGTIPAEYNSQQGYNQALIVKNNMMISGEFNGTHSTDNGNSWYRSLNGYWDDNSSDGNYIHSDHHKLGSLDGNLKFWSVNDGGLNYMTYTSNSDQKPTIEYKSAKTIVTQHYSVAINPNVNGDSYMVGNQDNDGFSKIDGVWYALALGDGIETAINYNNPNVRYGTNQSGVIIKSDNGFKGERNGDYWTQLSGVAFNHYMELDRTNPSILYVNAGKGTDDDGNPLPTGFYKVVDDGTQLTETNMDSGTKTYKFNTHANLVLAISDNNVIRKIPTDGSTPSSINGAANIGNNVTIESIDFSASNSNLIYVTSQGYNKGNKVFKSTDGGINFTNISGNLPDVIINKILYKQAASSTTLFVATNIGVYYTIDDGQNWTKLGAGLPNVDVKDIEINYTADKLVAATFGRGLWAVDISSNALNIHDLKNVFIALNIYPNPVTNNILKITTKENLNNLRFEIYNIVGGIVKKGKLNSTKEINTSSLVNNVYLIRVFNDKYSATKKFLLSK